MGVPEPTEYALACVRRAAMLRCSTDSAQERARSSVTLHAQSRSTGARSSPAPARSRMPITSSSRPAVPPPIRNERL